MTDKSPDVPIYRMSAVCGALLVAAWIVPRFIPNPEGGFAAGATAALTLFLMLGLALAASIVLAGLTWQRYAMLSTGARVAGFAPAAIVAAMLAWLFLFLSY